MNSYKLIPILAIFFMSLIAFQMCSIDEKKEIKSTDPYTIMLEPGQKLINMSDIASYNYPFCLTRPMRNDEYPETYKSQNIRNFVKDGSDKSIVYTIIESR